jgi:hypothetical protein
MSAHGYRGALPETKDASSTTSPTSAASGAGRRGAAGRRERKSGSGNRERNAVPFEIDSWEPSLLRKLLGTENTPDDASSDEN